MTTLMLGVVTFTLLLVALAGALVLARAVLVPRGWITVTVTKRTPASMSRRARTACVA